MGILLIRVSIRTLRAQKSWRIPAAPHGALPAPGRQRGKVDLMALLTAFQELRVGCTPPSSKASLVTLSNANVYSHVARASAASASLGAEILGPAPMHGVRTVEGAPCSGRSWNPHSLWDAHGVPCPRS